jgi:hypothetical protein
MDGTPNSWGVLDVVEGTWLWPEDVSASIERRKAAKETHVVTKSALESNKAVRHSGLSVSEL